MENRLGNRVAHLTLTQGRCLDKIEVIFWATAGKTQFSSPGERQDYYRRWLGRYLDLMPDTVLIAQTLQDSIVKDRSILHQGGHTPSIAGYLVGCLDTFAPSAQAVTDDISYYYQCIKAKLAPYPAHFHVNIAKAWQRLGYGQALVNSFIRLCREKHCPGVHVVTASGSKATQFYIHCGFEPYFDFDADGRQLAALVLPLPRRHVPRD